ncbi:Disease resistance protein [Melia azedarach]|uniref:Disease resistance protein n=1 Tax=Melia azedarach TaxID=155640 RepID=A0ACC1WQI4_MELAZ|nr:Disease resistance protein [Melia azedarach]
MICHSKLLAASCIQNLICLVVNGCDKLRYLFPSSTVKSLGQLRQVVISECTSIEAAILTEEEGMSEMMIFPRLRVLRLVDLPSLKMFCNCAGNLTVFPVISCLVIDKCGGMKTFVSNSVSAIAQVSAKNVHSNIPLFDEKVVAPDLEELTVRNMDNLRKIWDDHLTLNSFSKLRVLRVWNCCKLIIIFPSVMRGRLQALYNFNVVNYESLQEIFEVQRLGCGRIDAIANGQLRGIHLCQLPKLKHVWNLDAQGILCYENLESLAVHHCLGLKCLFPSSIARGLRQLKKLEIKSCMVEEIVAKEEVAVEIVPKSVFPQLTSLSLKNLPGLKSFYPGIHISEWPVLNELETSGCDKVKIFASEFQNHGESQHDVPIQTLFLVDKIVSPSLEKFSCFQHVTKLGVDGCSNLKHLFTADMAKSLVQLKILRISNCNVMEGVIVMEKERISEKLFPKLHQLVLKDLPQLKRFCNFSGDLIELFMLTVLVIDNCPNMGTFVSNSMCADMTGNEPDQETNSEDNLQPDMHPLFDEKVSLPHMEKLTIRKMDNLRKIWDGNQKNSDTLKVFQNLATLKVSECDKLMNILPSSVSTNNLTIVEVLKCNGLKSLVTSSTARSLMQLTRMDIADCKRIEQIVTVTDMENEVKDEISFKELEYLGLKCLPSLRSFCLGNCTLKFPSLDQVLVRECSKMETFSQGVVSTSKL